MLNINLHNEVQPPRRPLPPRNEEKHSLHLKSRHLKAELSEFTSPNKELLRKDDVFRESFTASIIRQSLNGGNGRDRSVHGKWCKSV